MNGLPAYMALSPLELAAGRPLGRGPARRLPAGVRMSPREALERALLPALERSPCFVAFSGGRDSSAILAVAVDVARRHGLPLPVPATMRFTGAPETEESEWQEAVISHLRLRDWEILDPGHELEYLGARARAGLLRHGLMWPENAHAFTAFTGLADSASVVTGLDGDGLLGDWRWAGLASVFGGRARLRRSDLRRIVRAAGPTAVRRRWRLGALPDDPFDAPWMTPPTREHARRLLAEQEAREPRTWPARLQWYWSLRYLRCVETAADTHLADAGWTACHPFMDGHFLAALAHEGGLTGYGSRTEIMQRLFGDLLPGPVVTRVGKAVFHDAFWGPESAEWAAEWDGTGLDEGLMDPQELRRDWALGSRSSGGLLLQWTWLQAQGADRTGDGRDGGVETAPVTGPADLEHR